MYKIFVNDKPLIITESLNNLSLDEQALPNIIFNIDEINDYFKTCENLSSKGLIVIAKEIDTAFGSIKKQLMPIEAAGGAVFNNKNQILLIKRMGKWDLPKGKIDAGETPEIAAIREVEEECGINKLTLGKFITTTYHTYKMHNHRFLKVTHWFFMTSTFNGKLVPQIEEQITQVLWEAFDAINIEKTDTYESMKDLLKRLILTYKLRYQAIL